MSLETIDIAITDNAPQCSIADNALQCAQTYADGAFVVLAHTEHNVSQDEDIVDRGISIREGSSTNRGELISFKPPMYSGFYSRIGAYDYPTQIIRHYNKLHAMTKPTLGLNSLLNEMKTVEDADGVSLADPTYTWALHKQLDMSGWSPAYKASWDSAVEFTSALYPNVDTFIFYNNMYDAKYRTLLSTRGDIDGDWAAGIPRYVETSSYDYWNYAYIALKCRANNAGDCALFAIGGKMEGGSIPHLLVAPPDNVYFIEPNGYLADISAVITGDNVYHILFKWTGTSAIRHVTFVESGIGGGAFVSSVEVDSALGTIPILIADQKTGTGLYMFQGAAGYRHLYKKWTATGEGTGTWDAAWSDCRATSGYTTKVIQAWATDQQGRLYGFVFDDDSTHWIMHCFYLDDDGVWRATYDSVRLCRFAKADDMIESRTFVSNLSYWPRRNIPYSGYCFTTQHGQKAAWMFYGSPQRSVDGSLPPIIYQWDSVFADGNL